MITVKPGETVIQHPEDVVVYRMLFADWSIDLDRPENTAARVTVASVRGVEPLQMRPLPYKPGTPAQDIRVTGGSKNGLYEVVRTVKSPTEVRRRAFLISVSGAL
jgi:hypothetical protein